MAQRSSTPILLEIHLLGPFRVKVDGAAIEEQVWARRKPALLIKLLALQPHHQLHREQVMETLWPDADPEAATNNLHKVIHQARRALEPALKSAADSHFILTQGQHVLLRSPGRLLIDMEEFERHAADALKNGEVEAHEGALAIYECDLLVEDLYEDWAAMRREQLRAQHQQLLSNLALLHERRGEHARAIERLKELVACDPTNEEAHRRLMRLYALTSNKHQALKQYQLCGETLRKELGAEPERATDELRQRIITDQIAPPPSLIETEHGAEAEQSANSLAILPLFNSSDDQSMDYLCGITENIIYSLSQLPGLRVMACSTVCHYKGREVDPREVGRELCVRAVVTGRVLLTGDTLIVRAELVDARTGEQLWGERYDRKLADLPALPEELSRDISEKLRLKLTREEQGRLAKRHTANPVAYQLFLKARYFWNKRTEEGLKKSIEYFQRAIVEDPRYAAAYAGMSDCYIILVGRHGLPAEEGLTQAKAAAKKALEIDDQLAEAHTALAHVMLHNWEWAEAEREFKRALELNPADPTAHQVYFEYLSAVGRVEEAIAEIKKAQELDPLSLPINSNVAMAFNFARQYDCAIEQCQKILEMDPNFYWAHSHLALAYEQKGMFDEAVAELLTAVELSRGNPHLLAALGYVYAVAGRCEDAQDVLGKLLNAPEHQRASPYYIAQIYAGLGERDKAFQWLERAYQERDAVMTHLNVTSRFDVLRSDPRFADLVRRVGLAP